MTTKQSGGLHVNATLKTRCGCQQIMDIPFPPQPYILLALKPIMQISEPVGLPKLVFETRRFELDHRNVVEAGGVCFAFYEERP